MKGGERNAGKLESYIADIIGSLSTRHGRLLVCNFESSRRLPFMGAAEWPLVVLGREDVRVRQVEYHSCPELSPVALR